MIEELYCIDLFSKAKHKIKLKFFSGLKIITDITGMLNFHNIFLGLKFSVQIIVQSLSCSTDLTNTRLFCSTKLILVYSVQSTYPTNYFFLFNITIQGLTNLTSYCDSRKYHLFKQTIYFFNQF